MDERLAGPAGTVDQMTEAQAEQELEQILGVIDAKPNPSADVDAGIGADAVPEDSDAVDDGVGGDEL